MNKLISLLLVVLLIVGCANKNENDDINKDNILKEEDKNEGDVNMNTDFKNPIATIKFKDLGEIKLELQVNEAPQSVFNFTELANSGYYDGLSMHRTAKDFVAQGGDPDGTGMGGPGYTIEGEFSNNGVNNKTNHSVGSIAFARSQHYDSAGSQFYLVLAEYPEANLNYMNSEYAAFGSLIEGLDVIETINNDYANPNDGAPIKPLSIESITVDTLGQDLPEANKLK